MFCSKCGSANADGAKFCAKCGTVLTVAVPEAAPAAATPTIRAAADLSSAVSAPTGKVPWLALVLSLVITGVGQAYNDDWKKGVTMFIGFVLGLMFTGGLLSLAIWIWSMVDAFRVASGAGKRW